MRPNLSKRLDEATATQIKAKLWAGERQANIAARFNVSQTTISRIVRGEQWYNAPWPNGELGPMPYEKAQERKAFGLMNAPVQRAVNPTTSIKMEPKIPSPPDTTGQLEAYDKAAHGDPSPPPTLEELEAQRAERERLRAIKNELLEREGEAAEARMNEELEGVLRTTDGEERTARPNVKHEPDLETLDWETIEKIAPKNRIVMIGREKPALRPAICRVFTALPETDWKSDRALKLINEVNEIMHEGGGNE